MKKYICRNCKDHWITDKELVENICPLCSMPLKQMIRDVFSESGILGVFKQLLKRYL